jgi:hypothetical protein
MIEITEINIDLDGVMVDFRKKALEVAGIVPEHDPNNKQLRRDFWKHIEMHVRSGKPFFGAMDPMEDAFVLWGYLLASGKPLVINSATGHIRGASEEKRYWVRKHLGHDAANAARFVRDAVMKSQYAHHTKVLIDDRRKAIDPWVAAGGIGILHTSAVETIEQLKLLGV